MVALKQELSRAHCTDEEACSYHVSQDLHPGTLAAEGLRADPLPKGIGSWVHALPWFLPCPLPFYVAGTRFLQVLVEGDSPALCAPFRV